MKVAIIAVGTELLFGQTVNTNAVYLSRELNLMGFDVMYHHTVGDNPARLVEMLDVAYKDCDMVITTGGLGPTQDDLTKEILNDYFGDELVLHEPSMESMKERFEKLGRKMTDNNIKQAYMPSRSHVFKNDQGTAPGCALEKDGKYAICLPGPPREMTAMFESYVRPYLEGRTDGSMCYRLIRTFGIGESDLETRLMDIIDGQTDPTLATYAKEGECYLRIASKRADAAEAESAVKGMLADVKKRIGEFIYDCDNRDLWDVVGEKLMAKNITISSAESCTGGMFAEKLTSVPGISAVFERSFVTYSNGAKEEILGVKKETLEKHGAVSEETAMEMAKGLRKVSGSRICVSVTGVAGPDGGTPEKPVGLVYIGAVCDDKEVCRKVQMRNISRQWNRNFSMLHMFDVVNRLIDGIKD
ncbi:MAG: competence/damage-inducible protein A [Bacillota bacterium]|nr:competence/damage-inducible protein A [Bacillota bacterium]